LGWLPSFFSPQNGLFPWGKRSFSRLSNPRYRGLPLHQKWL
jgi:hypothetical protein